MGKTLFTIKYDVIPEKREVYLDVARELKELMKAEGLEAYSVFEQKNKKNRFEEVYLFSSKEAFEEFDEDPNERIDMLMNKLSELIVQHSTHYDVMYEV